MKHITVLFLILALAALTGCDESTSPSKPNALHHGYNVNYIYIDDILDSCNNGNLSGSVTLAIEKRNNMMLLNNNGVIEEYDFDDYYMQAYASMFNPDYSPLDINGIMINGVSLISYQDGSYYANNNAGLYLNSGSEWNKFQVEPKGNFLYVSDSVQLPEELKIINLKRNDTLHRSTDFVISWTGSATAKYFEISVKMIDPKADTVSRKMNLGFSTFSPANGSYKLLANTVNQSCELNGKYDIRITAYTPIYKRISNGRDILIMAVLSHSITVNLTD